MTDKQKDLEEIRYITPDIITPWFKTQEEAKQWLSDKRDNRKWRLLIDKYI